MAGKKWNNQGGSNFGNQNRQNRNQKPKGLPSVPQLDDLRESNITSFKLIKVKPAKPDYGQFGDAIWTLDIFLEDEYIDKIDEIDDLDIPIPTIRDIKIMDEPPLNPRYEDRTDPENNPNLFPDFVYNEYEIVVKFYQQSAALGLVLTIMSGQAYAARNNLNDPKLDLAIVIVSSAPITINQGAINISSTVNIVKLLNSKQNPIYSLYNWIISKLPITTKNDGKYGDPIFTALEIDQLAIKLPSIGFVAVNNGLQCGLFYDDTGLQPKQICIHAIDKVLDFKISSQKDQFYWSVLYANQPIPLCLTLNQLPIVSIRFKSGTETEYKWAEGIFEIEVFLTEPLDQPLEVDIVVSGTADTAKYIVNGLTQGFGRRYVTIQALSLVADITIETLANPSELTDKNVVLTIDPTTIYDILANTTTATIKPQLPVVSILFSDGSNLSTIPANQQYSNAILSIDTALSYDLFVDINLTSNGALNDFSTNGVIVPNTSSGTNFTTVVIFAGNTTRNLLVEPLNNANYLPNPRTISLAIAPLPQYDIDLINTGVVLTVVPVSLNMRLNISSANNGFVDGASINYNTLTTVSANTTGLLSNFAAPFGSSQSYIDSLFTLRSYRAVYAMQAVLTLPFDVDIQVYISVSQSGRLRYLTAIIPAGSLESNSVGIPCIPSSRNISYQNFGEFISSSNQFLPPYIFLSPPINPALPIAQGNASYVLYL